MNIVKDKIDIDEDDWQSTVYCPPDDMDDEEDDDNDAVDVDDWRSPVLLST